MHYLGLCAIIKDEQPFIEEWLAYHAHLGVQVFFLYDNGSNPRLTRTLRNYSRPGFPFGLRIHYIPGVCLQLGAYLHCVTHYAHLCKWLAVIDGDEFIVPKQCDSIPAMLEEFEPYAGLAISWKVFGSNGHLRRPAGLQIENFTRALSSSHTVHNLVKTIARPEKVLHFANPHICEMRNARDIIVTEDHEPVSSPVLDRPSWEKSQINHYFYRSHEDFFRKIHSPTADTATLRKTTSIKNVPAGEEEDLSATRFAPGVREMMRRAESG